MLFYLISFCVLGDFLFHLRKFHSVRLVQIQLFAFFPTYYLPTAVWLADDLLERETTSLLFCQNA